MMNLIEQVIEQAVVDKKRIVGCTVLVSQNGRLIYQTAAGFADRERHEAGFYLSSLISQ